MNRYGSSKRISSINSKIIMDQQEFEEGIQQPVPLVDVRFKSIPSSKMLIAQAQAIEYQKKRKQPLIDELRITQTQSAQKLRINNFFGSNKILQRKFDTGVQQQLNPQNRQRRQFSEQEDNHDRLAKLIQKQIQERNKWEKQAQQNQIQEELDQNHLTNQFNSEISKQKNALLVNDVQSFHKVQSRNKLSKVGSDKFLSNVEKNKLFQSKGQDIDYLKPVQDKPSMQQQQEQNSPQNEKKKRSVSQLKPLKKKPSTYEVLNQLDMYKKKDTQTPETQIKTPVKTLNISKSRIIGLDVPNLLVFNKQVIPKNRYIEGTLKRNRSGIDNTFWPEYRLIFDQMSIIYAKKTVKGYVISMDPNSQKYGFQPKLGSIKGNFVGSYYNLYSGLDQSEILATIFYNPDSKEITTEVQLYIKNEQIQYKSLDRDNQKDTDANLQILYSQGQNRAQGKIRKFINKKPHFDQKTKMYKLDFGGKAPIPSVKNTILIDAQTQRDKILTVGKWGSDHFYIRADYPFSPLILMGYLMSSFNFKFVTQ